MILKGDSGDYLTVSCEKCDKIFHKRKINYKQDGDAYYFDPPIVCPKCDNTKSLVSINGIVSQSVSQSCSDNDDVIRCPRCGSIQITAGNKGFGLSKAAIGGLLLGPVGLLGGLIGSKKIKLTCLKCGKQWEVGNG